jgi:HEAT repeat protein
VRRVVVGLTDDVLYQARLVIGPPARLAQALRERKDTARLAAAVEIAGLRRAREAVPALIELLRHQDEQISDRAIGALVAIGDRAAVKPLTRLSSFQDTARMAKVLDAIGSLGGQEARDYLEFVSSGHEDADIRNLAAEALERMSRGTGPR